MADRIPNNEKKNQEINETLFRKKSMEQLSTPDSLQDYIRVANPGTWLFLVAVIIFLTGTLIWGGTVLFESVELAEVEIQKPEMVIRMDEDKITCVAVDTRIYINSEIYTVTEIKEMDVPAGKCRVLVDKELPNGIFYADVVVEHIRPIVFVTN